MSSITNKNKRALIITMIALSLIVLIIPYFYYNKVNSSKDPRIKHARELYENYNELTVQNNFAAIFSLLDSVENSYEKIKHYQNSFEVGVLYNNRAAAYLTMALYENKPEEFMLLSKDSLLQLAQLNVLKSISIYESWLNTYHDLTLKDIKELISEDFYIGLDKYSIKEKDDFLRSRIKEIETAQFETERRLSVAYTNLGIIYRHFDDYENTINSYQKAIDLWDQNITAENNLNILLGRPLKKRNLIQKLFPPKRKEDK